MICKFPSFGSSFKHGPTMQQAWWNNCEKRNKNTHKHWKKGVGVIYCLPSGDRVSGHCSCARWGQTRQLSVLGVQVVGGHQEQRSKFVEFVEFVVVVVVVVVVVGARKSITLTVENAVPILDNVPQNFGNCFLPRCLCDQNIRQHKCSKQIGH